MPLNKELDKAGIYKQPFYGMAIFEAESDEKIMAIWEDPDYLRIIRPDEDKFFDKSKTELVMGKIAVLIDGCKSTVSLLLHAIRTEHDRYRDTTV